MRAMVLLSARTSLVLRDRADTPPGPGDVRLRIDACGVCRTDLHLADGDLPFARYPVIPGHEIVGRVEAVGPGVLTPRIGERVGVPWLGHACGRCPFCLTDRENLCDAPRFTGCTRDGGFATHVCADAAFTVKLPPEADPVALAPLLCAGLIGWRSLAAAGTRDRTRRIGLYGFGAAAHIIAQICVRQGREVYAFTRPGDLAAQNFAREVGASWAGGADDRPPARLDAAILFAPVGDLVPAALRSVQKGGTVVCGGIHMTDIPSFPYDILWHERRIVSVANLTRRDATDFFAAIAGAGITTRTHAYSLSEANTALADLRDGRLQGAAVLVPDS